MDKLSARDKSLLLLLSIALVLFLPYYFYTTGVMDKIDIKSAELAVLTLQEKELNEKETLLPKVKEKSESSAAEALGTMPNTTDMIKSYEVHYLFTELIKNSALEHQMLTVAEPAVIPEINVGASEILKFDDTAIGLSPLRKSELDTVGKMKAENMAVTFNVSGTFENILKLSDSISAYSDYITLNTVIIPNVDDPTGQTNASFTVSIYLATLLK